MDYWRHELKSKKPLDIQVNTRQSSWAYCSTIPIIGRVAVPEPYETLHTGHLSDLVM